jgi:hypothetical protein
VNPQTRTLNDADLANFARALKPLIAAAVEPYREQIVAAFRHREKRPGKRKHGPQKFSALVTERAANRLEDLSVKLDRVERYQREKTMSYSATAATIAAQTTQAKRFAGDKFCTFQGEHKRIMAELLENPQAARTRYSRELAKADPPTPRYQLELSNAKKTATTYVPVRQRAEEIARRRCGGDPMRMNAETRRAISEIFDAQAKKMTGHAAAVLYGRDDEDAALFSEAYGSISTRASEMARRRAQAGQGSFMECYRAAIEELHREATTSYLRD